MDACPAIGVVALGATVASMVEAEAGRGWARWLGLLLRALAWQLWAALRALGRERAARAAQPALAWRALLERGARRPCVLACAVVVAESAAASGASAPRQAQPMIVRAVARRFLVGGTLSFSAGGGTYVSASAQSGRVEERSCDRGRALAPLARSVLGRGGGRVVGEPVVVVHGGCRRVIPGVHHQGDGADGVVVLEVHHAHARG